MRQRPPTLAALGLLLISAPISAQALAVTFDFASDDGAMQGRISGEDLDHDGWISFDPWDGLHELTRFEIRFRFLTEFCDPLTGSCETAADERRYDLDDLFQAAVSIAGLDLARNGGAPPSSWVSFYGENPPESMQTRTTGGTLSTRLTYAGTRYDLTETQDFAGFNVLPSPLPATAPALIGGLGLLALLRMRRTA